MVLAQVIRGFSNLALARQEHEHVTRAFAPKLIDGCADRIVQVELAAFHERPPALLNREQPARDLDHRRRARCGREVAREPIRVDRRRGHDDLQVGSPRQDLPQVAEQEVDVQAALVRLVDDDRVVGAQQRIGLSFGEQDAVGHQLDAGAGRQAILEADLEADDLTQRRLQLLGDALGHARRRDASRLRVADQLAGVRLAAAEFERDLRKLRGLARTGFAANDHDLMCLQRLRDLVASRRDGQRFGEGDRRQRVGGGL